MHDQLLRPVGIKGRWTYLIDDPFFAWKLSENGPVAGSPRRSPSPWATIASVSA
jgi:hypothetical protein